MEWKKLKRFHKNLTFGDSAILNTISESYTSILKVYTKDSLKILLAKLIGVNQLEEKGLLDEDISKNPDYYLELLADLKKSEMNPSQYLFLSLKLTSKIQQR